MTAVAEETSSRRRRIDAGVIRATERDVRGMAWVVEMAAMPFDLLQRVLGAGSYSVLQNVVSRWRRAGWARTARLGPGPQWCWATRDGIRRFGRHEYAEREPNAGRLEHLRAVVEFRMWIEDRRRDDDPEWVSERELRWEQGTRRGSDAARLRLPDGVVQWTASNGARVSAAVEVELSPKPFELVRDNMANGLAQHRQVVWVVTPRTRSLVLRARDEQGEAAARVQLVELDTVRRDLYGEEARC